MFKKKSQSREWLNSIVFAVTVVTAVRWIAMCLCVIPSGSMEKTLLTGDYIVVSKMHYGALTPKTPLQVPLTHQKVETLNIKSYLEWIQLPQYRLPGFSRIKREDCIIFNNPTESDKPIDLKTFYIKRCVGMPGDVLRIENKQLYINDALASQHKGIQYEYLLKTTRMFNEQFFEKYEIRDYFKRLDQDGYTIRTTVTTAGLVSKVPGVVSVEPIVQEPGVCTDDFYPENALFKWNKDNFGPLKIPGTGMTIQINEENLALYQDIIENYEGHDNLEIKNNQLWIGGNHIHEYAFCNNYYFMMGDNRDNSTDSRIFGFVPENHIVGKGILVLFSIDPQKGFFSKVRWKRIFQWIH